MLSYDIPQLIEVCNLSNSVVKSIKPPVQTNEIFCGGTASLILSSTTSVIFVIFNNRRLSPISPLAKYVIWSADGSLVTLMSKHSECAFAIHFGVVVGGCCVRFC